MLRITGDIGVLTAVFLRELIRSSASVAKAALSINTRLTPAIIAVPLEVRTDLGIAVLANLVSLTPGTTSLHVSEDRTILYVHCLDAPDTRSAIADIKNTFEERIRRIEA